MKSLIRRPDLVNNNLELVVTQIDRILIPERAVMAIDGSTKNTGISILREKDGALYYTCAFTRDRGETPVQYKVRLKRAVYDILIRNRFIEHVYYEEPFIGYATAAPNLFMLRTFIEELKVEYEPHFDYLNHTEVNNKRWKKLFLAPDKCPTGTELEKVAVREKLEKYLPFMKDATQDEVDATCLGFVACTSLNNGTEDSLDSKKKPRPFQYGIQFIGADDDDQFCEVFSESYEGPKKILENGITLTDIKPTKDFDKHIYETMMQDDKVVVIKFPSDKHANLILQYKIGGLAASWDYIYAVVWRKTRKG